MNSLKLLSIALVTSFAFQQSILVTKNSGEEVRLTSVDFLQGNKRSDVEAISYLQSGETKSILYSELRRINLKGVSSKKGITSWDAVIVTKENEKIEAVIPLDRVYGLDKSGEEIKISSTAIDKISF